MAWGGAVTGMAALSGFGVWSCPDLADRFDCLNQVDALVSNSIGDT